MSLRPSQIIGAMSKAKFSEMMAKSPRTVRETLFGRLNIKANTKTIVPRPHQKNEERIGKLHVTLSKCGAGDTKEQELCEELVRNWLVHKSPMLAATMDFFEVKHVNGLTEQEIDFLEKLDPAKTVTLVQQLSAKFDHEEMAIYLRFLKVPHLRGALPPAAYPKDAPAPITEDPTTPAATAPTADAAAP